MVLVELAEAPRIRLVGNLVAAAGRPARLGGPRDGCASARGCRSSFDGWAGLSVPRWVLETP